MDELSAVSNEILSKPAIWIDKPRQLDQFIEVLHNETLVAVDTESDSLYSYFEKVCLIQFSTAQADYLVDPLNVDVSGLASFFAASSIQKIFHAAEYDILTMKRDYGFTFTNLFDTMIAARILGWPRYGLGSLLKEHFGVKLDKRFQRYNWGRRPLSTKALNYARLDTHYLIPLRKIQFARLQEQKRVREALEAFERGTQVESSPKVFDPDDFWKVKSARDLTPQQQAVLRQLFILRDEIARKIDRPPFKVVNDFALIHLAKRQPKDKRELKEIKGVSRQLVRYNSRDILQAIRHGQTNPPPRYPYSNNHRPDDDTLNRYETLRQWRNNLATARGVEPDVIMGNDALMSIARRNPESLTGLTRIGVLGEWQLETYGQKLLNVLKSLP
jgi:ribonuclease D